MINKILYIGFQYDHGIKQNGYAINYKAWYEGFVKLGYEMTTLFYEDYSKDDLQKGSVDFFTSSGNREPSGNISFSIQIKNETEKENIISIDYRQTGDGFLLKGREGTRKLKKLFQQWKVPPWMRQFVPIINYNGECVAIADYAICEMDDNVIIDQVLWQPNINYDWRANL